MTIKVNELTEKWQKEIDEIPERAELEKQVSLPYANVLLMQKATLESCLADLATIDKEHDKEIDQLRGKAGKINTKHIEAWKSHLLKWIDENKQVMSRLAFDNYVYGVDPDDLINYIKDK